MALEIHAPKLEKIYKNFNIFMLCNGVLTQTVNVP